MSGGSIKPVEKSMKSKPNPQPASLDYTIRSFAAGGIAGGVAKTAFAPFERVRILFQVQHAEFARFSGSLRGAVLAARHILRTQGFKALYRGHSLSLARAVPHAAVGYTAYEYAKVVFIPTKEQDTPMRRSCAGAVAGLAALPVTYPFELARVRMATDTFGPASTSPQAVSVSTSLPGTTAPATRRPRPHPTPRSAVRAIYASSPRSAFPLAPFYSGFPVTALGSVPYRGGIFLIWETLHASARRRLGEAAYKYHRSKINFLIGAVAGAGAQAATYPLEIIRRRQQVTTGGSVGSVVKLVWQASGWRGFYVGMGLGLAKQVPVNAVSLGTWQMAKRWLNID